MQNKILRLMVTGVLALISFGCSVRTAAGVTREEERKVEAFHSVVISGSENLFVSQGSDQKLRIVADDDVLRVLKTQVRNGVLYVEIDEDYFRYDSDINVYVTMPTIEMFHVVGSGDVTGETPIVSDHLTLKISGSGRIMMDVKAQSIKTSIAGSGDVRLTGSTESHDVGISGSGSVSALEMTADRYDISISGSGASKVHVKSSLDISISGSGKVSYTGNPDKLNTQVSGSGTIRKL